MSKLTCVYAKVALHLAGFLETLATVLAVVWSCALPVGSPALPLPLPLDHALIPVPAGYTWLVVNLVPRVVGHCVTPKLSNSPETLLTHL